MPSPTPRSSRGRSTRAPPTAAAKSSSPAAQLPPSPRSNSAPTRPPPRTRRHPPCQSTPQRLPRPRAVSGEPRTGKPLPPLGAMVFADNAEDVAITGPGTLDGNGSAYITERGQEIYVCPHQRPFTVVPKTVAASSSATSSSATVRFGPSASSAATTFTSTASTSSTTC